MIDLHSNLEFAGLGQILDAFERLVLLSIHVESVDLQARNGQLWNVKVYIDRRIRLEIRTTAGHHGDLKLEEEHDCHNFQIKKQI